MVYAISLSSEELDDIDWQLQLDQSMGKTMGFSLRPRDLSPQVALVFARTRPSAGTAHPAYQLRWLGVVKHPKGRKVGTRDALIKVEPLWRSPHPVELASVTASLSRMDAEELTAMLSNEVVVLPDELGERLVAALREQGPRFAELLDGAAGTTTSPSSPPPTPSSPSGAWTQKPERRPDLLPSSPGPAEPAAVLDRRMPHLPPRLTDPAQTDAPPARRNLTKYY